MDIQKLVGNLIDNAIKYTPNDGDINITINQTSLIIKDSGIGMSQGLQQKLGERFTRDTQAIQLNYEWVWLGLSIVYKIIWN